MSWWWVGMSGERATQVLACQSLPGATFLQKWVCSVPSCDALLWRLVLWCHFPWGNGIWLLLVCRATQQWLRQHSFALFYSWHSTGKERWLLEDFTTEWIIFWSVSSHSLCIANCILKGQPRLLGHNRGLFSIYQSLCSFWTWQQNTGCKQFKPGLQPNCLDLWLRGAFK